MRLSRIFPRTVHAYLIKAEVFITAALFQNSIARSESIFHYGPGIGVTRHAGFSLYSPKLS